MKTNSRNLLNLATILTLSTSFMPAMALARGGSDDNISPSPSAQAEVEQEHSGATRSGNAGLNGDGRGFCNRFSTSSAKLTKDFDNRVSKLESDQTADSKRRGDAEQAATLKIGELRQKADELRQEHITKLESEASTDTQKQAVNDFQTAVQTAVSARRAAVDSARATFKTGVAGVVTARQLAIKQVLAIYRTSVATALTQAQASCAAGTNPQVVMQTLKSQLEAAHTTLKTAMQNVSKVGDQVKQLAASRNAAVQAADNSFKAAVQDAAAKLKGSLGQTS